MITTEDVKKALDFFIKMDSGNRDISEALQKEEPYYYKRHKICIVPTTVINKYFDCPEFRMSKDVVNSLKAFGAKRAYRQVYESGKVVDSILCWVFNV